MLKFDSEERWNAEEVLNFLKSKNKEISDWFQKKYGSFVFILEDKIKAR